MSKNPRVKSRSRVRSQYRYLVFAPSGKDEFQLQVQKGKPSYRTKAEVRKVVKELLADAEEVYVLRVTDVRKIDRSSLGMELSKTAF